MAVSVAAGTAAVVSAFPQLSPARLVIALTLMGVITVVNLRGIRDVSVPVAVLVYGFLVVMVAMIVRGLFQCVQGCAAVPFEQAGLGEAGTGLTALVVLRAFATASTSLTGVEAVSNGVGAFRPPAVRNAAKTLGIIGLLAVPLLAGIAYLATRIEGVVAFPGVERTVTSQIAAAVFGAGSIGFYAVQVATAAILFLAANTAYADFPRLASSLARDQYLPRQLARRGDRLVLSNGILALSGAAAVLVVVSGARVTLLVGLYIVGVFTAFSLSQAGMVRHWLRERTPGWRVSLSLNLVGAVATAAVLLIVMVTKFFVGAWLVLLVGPVLVWAMVAINRHYRSFARAVGELGLEPQQRRDVNVVVIEDRGERGDCLRRRLRDRHRCAPRRGRVGADEFAPHRHARTLAGTGTGSRRV